MDKDQWLIISGLQIRPDEAQRIPTLFRLFSMVGIRWEQIFYIISQVQFLPSSTILSPIRPTNNSKSVAFHTNVPMWSFNWSWYFNERSISVLRANYDRKYFSLFGLLLQFPRHHCHFYVNTWRNFVYYDYEPVSLLLPLTGTSCENVKMIFQSI